MKKKIPLIIHQTLQPVAKQNFHLLKPVIVDDAMFYVADKDEDSDFFFKVLKQENKNGVLHYCVEIKPTSDSIVQSSTYWIQISQIVNTFNNWIKLLDTYNKTYTFFDDPILKSYEKDLNQRFEILNENTDMLPFSLEKQLYIHSYLIKTKKTLINLKQNKDENYQTQLDELEKEVNIIQSNLTKDTQKKVIERLSKFWAKTQKVGLDLLKEVFVSVSAELAKKLITGG